MSKKTKKELSTKDIHAGHRERVKKRFRSEGLDAFEPHEALEMLLFYAYRRMDTNEKAHEMIREFGSISNLFEASTEEIIKRCDVSEKVAVLISMMLPVHKKYKLSRENQKKVILKASKYAGEFATSLFLGETNECFYVILLDNKRSILHYELLSRGTLNQTFVYPRRIVELCIYHNAISIIIAHNHPSGILYPSDADLKLTRQINDALKHININLLDHFIVSGDNFYSFAEKGKLT